VPVPPESTTAMFAGAALVGIGDTMIRVFLLE
jgi:hypothetical protein